MKIFFLIIMMLLISDGLNSQSLWNNQGHIPQAYQVEWTNAGLLSGTPQSAERVFDVTDYGAAKDNGTDDYTAIMRAVDSAKAYGGVSIVYFPQVISYNVCL